MRFVSPKAHGLLDYATAGAMIALPRMMQASNQTTNLMTGAGAAIIGMSLLTRYPLGIVRVLPMQAHLAADAALDAILFREAGKMDREPQVRNAIMGMAIAGSLATLLTSPRP